MRRRIGKRAGGLIMTPMINIVFQLIAFFIFATSYSADEVNSDVRPPETGVSGAKLEQGTVLLEIDRQGRLLGLFGKGPVPVSDPKSQQLLESLFRDAGPDPVVVIRADRDVPYAVVDQVLEFCRGRKLRSVILRLQMQQS